MADARYEVVWQCEGPASLRRSEVIASRDEGDRLIVKLLDNARFLGVAFQLQPSVRCTPVDSDDDAC